MNIDYTFSVIRYVHDVVTGEFVNVGIVLYAPGLPYARARCATRFERVRALFPDADTTDLCQVMKFVEEKVEEFSPASDSQLACRSADADDILRSIIPLDDSAIQFTRMGGGITADPNETLQTLYTRYIECPVKNRLDETIRRS
jgi:DUF3037 family protein